MMPSIESKFDTFGFICRMKWELRKIDQKSIPKSFAAISGTLGCSGIGKLPKGSRAHRFHLIRNTTFNI